MRQETFLLVRCADSHSRERPHDLGISKWSTAWWGGVPARCHKPGGKKNGILCISCMLRVASLRCTTMCASGEMLCGASCNSGVLSQLQEVVCF